MKQLFGLSVIIIIFVVAVFSFGTPEAQENYKNGLNIFFGGACMCGLFSYFRMVKKKVL